MAHYLNKRFPTKSLVGSYLRIDKDCHDRIHYHSPVFSGVGVHPRSMFKIVLMW